jgi:general secretion pathway protein L
VLILTPTAFSLSAATPTSALDWVRSPDGRLAAEHGSSAPSLLPVDNDVVLMLPPRAVSWHRVALPKVAAGRLRAALDGMLEDLLLNDPAELHFALEPGSRPGQTLWVAACHKSWLKSWLQVLEAAGRPVSRIVPALWPTSAGGEHRDETVHWAHDEGDRVWLATATPLGVRCVPLRENGSSSFGPSSTFGTPSTFGDSTFGGLGPATRSASEHLPAASDPATTHWFADPSITALAEQVCNQRFDLMPPPDWMLGCAQSDWNLAQFDLSLSAGVRRSQRLRRTLRQWRSAPAWRPARWGLAALVGAQLLGLNAAAWHERSLLSAKQEAVQQTLQTSFPQVTLVLDAPVQMQRELARLQQASGALTPGDLEALLTAIDQAANGESMVPSSIEYTQGEGRFKGWRASEDQVRALQQSLERNGWRVRFDGSEITLRPPEP